LKTSFYLGYATVIVLVADYSQLDPVPVIVAVDGWR
jgi:hypothetical protein